MSLFALSASLLSACGTEPRRSDYPRQADQALSSVSDWSQSQAELATSVTSLNQLISAARLDALLGEALTANPNLQQTLLTLKIRRAEQRQTNAQRLPQSEAGVAASTGRDSDSTTTAAVRVSWELDVWRKLADENAAAGKDVAEQQMLYQAARDTLAAEVMSAWLDLIARQHAIDIERRRLDTLTRNAEFILQRYRNGLGSLEDLDSARTTVASSQAAMEAYRESLAQLQRSLGSLLGRLNQQTVPIPADYPAVLTPLADLPRQNLGRRPDLRAAYLAIEAADLRTSVAYRELLPSISIEAALTSLIESPGSILSSDPVWSLLGQLTAPLYQGGRLRAEINIRKLETAQAYQAYRETLLIALTEVGDALGLEQSLAKQQAHIEHALASAHDNLRQYQRSYRAGLVDILQLLIVQQNTYDLEAQLDDLLHQRLANRITLGLALGLGVSE